VSGLAHLSGVLGGLAALLLASLRPGEVDNGNDEERVASIGDTGQSVVPGSKCSKDAECATRFDAAGVGVTAGVAEVADAEEEEGQVQSEEEEEEGHSGFEGADQEDEGKDEPALCS